MRLARHLTASALTAVVALVATAAVAAAAPRAHTAIINGTVAPGPGPLALIASDIGQCSGSVVSSNVVLTAAHCVHDPDSGALLDPGSFVVQTGAVHAAGPAGFFTRVSRLVSYIWLPSNSFGDLALLQLANPTPAPALGLATSTDTALLTPGTVAVAEGWGVDVLGAHMPSADLRAGGQVVQSPNYCSSQALMAGVSLNTASTLCAIDPQAINGICSGDSGGPLVAKRADGTLAQIGIASFGPADCTPTRPGFFTRVDAFSNWIANWTTIFAPPPPPAPVAPAPGAPVTVAPPPATTTTTPAAVPAATPATRYSRYTAHGGYLAASVPADGLHVTWLRIGLNLTCKRSTHIYINDIFSAPAKAGWSMSASSPLQLTLTKPSSRRFFRRTDTIRMAPGPGGLYGTVTVSMRARAAKLGTCTAAVRSFRLTASR